MIILIISAPLLPGHVPSLQGGAGNQLWGEQLIILITIVCSFYYPCQYWSWSSSLVPSLPSNISPQGGECPRGKGGSSPCKVESPRTRWWWQWGWLWPGCCFLNFGVVWSLGHLSGCPTTRSTHQPSWRRDRRRSKISTALFPTNMLIVVIKLNGFRFWIVTDVMYTVPRYGLSVPLSALSATEGRPLSLNFDFN